MLRELRIRNFAVIESVAVEFRPGLNVLTGETGAGKSMLIDAILLVLGARAQTDVIRSDADAATVEAVFDVEPRGAVAATLDEAGLPPPARGRGGRRGRPSSRPQPSVGPHPGGPPPRLPSPRAAPPRDAHPRRPGASRFLDGGARRADRRGSGAARRRPRGGPSAPRVGAARARPPGGDRRAA